MRTYSNGVARRIMSFILVIAMLMSMGVVGIVSTAAADVALSDNGANVDTTATSASLGEDALSQTGASGTGGDASLITHANNTSPYIIAESTQYSVDQAILVTAGNGTRAALYSSSVTAPSASNTPIYTYDLTYRDGQTFDLRTGVYNSGSGVKQYLAEGTYNLFLFTDSGYTVGAQTTINIINGNINTVDTNTYVQTNRKEYNYGDNIIIKAKASSYTDAWVGVYATGADSITTAPEYIVYVGTGYSTNYSGTNTDLIESSVVNTGMELEVGTYDVRLFSGKSTSSTVLASTKITVGYNIFKTNKTTYGYGERILSKADVYSQSDASISNQLQVTGESVAFRSGPSTSGTTVYTRLSTGANVTLASTSGGSSTSNWAHLKYSSYTGYMITWLEIASGSDVKIYGTLTAAAPLYASASTSGTKTISSVPAGTAYNYLGYASNTFIKVQIGGYTGYIYRASTGTSQVYQYYRLHDTSSWPTYDDTNARVALYNSGETASTDPATAWYYLKDYSKSTVMVQDLGSNGSAGGINSDLTPGTYNLYLFGTSDYTAVASKTITVSEAVTGYFSNGAYQVDNLSDGFANGQVALAIDPSSNYGYIGTGDAVVYWADADGNPLEGYNAFAKVPIDKKVISFDMQPYTIIPEGATGLVAYVAYNGVEGTTGLYIPLPTGCATYTGLDEGIISEYHVLSDTKLGHTTYASDEHFVAALTDIANNSDSSAIVINGDVTDWGPTAQFNLIDTYKAQVEAATGKTLPNVYITKGNTDYWTDTYTAYVNNHGGNITEDSLYYSAMIDGYKHIFLTCDMFFTNDLGYPDAREISEAQLQWLDAELADNEENNDGKPVFLFLHLPIENTVDVNSYYIENVDDFSAVVKKYNNVVVFTGHGLVALNSPGAVFGGSADLPVVVNSGAIATTAIRLNDGTFEFDNDSAHGYYVRVYDDKVVLLGRDFISGTWIPEACRVLYNEDVSAEDSLLMQFGDTVTASEYITNPNGRTVTAGLSSDTDIVTVSDGGTITSADKKEGTAIVTTTALPTDTEVVKRTETSVRVVEGIDYSYYLMGSFDNWTDGYVMNPTSDNEDVITTTVKLSEGTYDFGLKSFDDRYGTAATINDATTEAITLTKNSEDNLQLVATGGNYTFTYTISTNTLTVEHTPDSGTSGNIDLFDRADNTDPYIYTSKEEYVLGESIYVTAQGGSWVGIYPASTTEYGKTYSYFYYTDGLDGVAVDIRTLVLNGNDETNDPTRTTGAYKAVLFGTSNYSQPLEEVYFDVVNANSYSYSATHYISTDKTTYFYGEDIMISGWTDRPDLNPWVAVVESGTTPSSSNLPYWYYLPQDDTGVLSTSQNLVDVSQKNNGVDLEPGTYDVYLYRTSSYNYPRGYVTITVLDAAGSVDTDKDVYGYGEDVTVTVSDLSGARLSDCWIGVYDESVINGALPTSGSGSKSWYYVYKQDSYAQVIQDVDPTKGATDEVTVTGKAFHGNPGTYTAVLFTTTDYSSPVAKKTFTITEEVTGAFIDGAYQVDNLSDGFANGRVALELSDIGYSYIGESDVAIYWADANGNPLEGYTALAKHPIDKNIITFDMYPYTIIPEGAAGLVAYVLYDGVQGTDGYVIDLPEGTATYTGLDDGILSEFQMVSDIHIYSPDVTTYSDGTAKLDNIQARNYSHSNFQAMLSDIAQNSPNSSGIFINGDIANNGFAEEYAEIMPLYNEVADSLGVALPQMYVNLGNHDSYADMTIAPYVEFANSLGADITADAPYYAKDINGYRYIFLAGDNTDYYGRTTGINPDRINYVDAEISDAQLEWLDAQLSEYAQTDPDKPVFVMLHQALYNTVAGSLSGQGYDGVVNYEEVEAILNKYNNVIYLSGHSHYELNTPQNINGGSEEIPVSINTSSVNYPWSVYYSADGTTVAGVAEGFYVRVYEDKTIFLGRNFTTGEWIPDACYVIYNKDVQAESVEVLVKNQVSVTDYVTNLKDRELTFTSSDSSIAAVDENGNISAIYPGTATITVFAAATDTEVIARENITVNVIPNILTVEFVDWDGTVIDTQQIEYGSPATAPEDPTREGNAQYSYVFDCWDKDFSEVLANMTVTATYTQLVNKYTVTFKNWDGTVLSTQEVEYGSAAVTPDEPTKEGSVENAYIFAGWDTDFSCITEDITVTATFTKSASVYIVQFVNLDGTVISTQEVEFGSAATAPAEDPSMEPDAQYTYTFSGWDKEFDYIISDTTVTAVYTLTTNKYTVNFVDWNGATIVSHTVKYGSAATAPADPTREGYTFTGWDKDFSNITGDLTVNAVYTPAVYTVTFVDWDGSVIDSQEVAYDTAATAPADPTRVGYTFAGWDADFSAVKGNLTVNATYIISSYTVTFKDHDGTVLKTESVKHGSAATAPADPTRSGYVFTGWDKDFSNITGETTVTAQYATSKIYVKGGFNNWETTNPMITSSGNIVTATIEIEAGTYEFKIDNNGTWYGNGGTIVDTTLATSSVGWEMKTSDDNCTLTASGGTYVFNFNTSTHYLEILYYPNVTLMGISGDWETGITMQPTADRDVVTATVELTNSTQYFKIKEGSTWLGNVGTIVDTTLATSAVGWEMSSSVETNCTLQATGGTYVFNYTISTNKVEILYTPASTEETGENTATIYVDTENSDFSNLASPYIYIWDPETGKNIGELWPGKKLEGPNAEGYYYRTFKFDESYQFIINDGASLQTEDSAVHTETELYITFNGGTSYTEGKAGKFWIDLNPDDDTSDIDLLYPEYIDGMYYFFLPSGVNAKSIEFHYTEGSTLKISYITIKDGGVMNLSGGVNKSRTYVLGGSFSGKFMVKQSSNVSSVYTLTTDSVPQGIGYGEHKDDYSSSGSIMMMNSDATVRLSTADLKKIKGRGNSTWEASNELIGKYAYNITLSEKAGLISDESLSKKYCLVSFNADEARMRNMLVYDLAEAIGVQYVADYEVVDFYNNNRYIGSYLLTDKIEIGDPLVDITDLDDINEGTSDNNAAIYGGDTDPVFSYGGSSSNGVNETSTPGFYKYVSNLDEPAASAYANSGFLLEFELSERFADEPSGFISDKGQQIVCKYPEYATKNEIQFIMDLWNEAEAIMYDETAAYEDLDAVIDVESFAKMYLVQELSKNLDGGATSYFVYYDGGKLHAGVSWDYDWTLGQYTQSGDANLSVDNQTSGKFEEDAKLLLNDPEGWWINSKEIYPATGTLNAQAALCQNDNFWNVVKAEWNELFYDTAITFSDSTVSSVSELDLKILEYYNLVTGSTAMDEFKWGIIESDPLASWGATDTGDTHDAATVWLNNFYYLRLRWMNEQLASTDYDLAPPTLETSKASYGIGETVTLTATCNSSGSLTYNFYDADGNLVDSVTTEEGTASYSFVSTKEMNDTYSVVVTTENTTSEDATATAQVIVREFNFEVKVNAPESVAAGMILTFQASAESESSVYYYLYDAEGNYLNANGTGKFDIITNTDEAGTTLEFVVEAITEVNGIEYTATKEFTVYIIDFVFSVELTGPESVEAGSDVLLKASASSPAVVTYTFYNASDNSVVASNVVGTALAETQQIDVGKTKSYYVVAETTAFGVEYTATSDVIKVIVTEVTDFYNVTIYFKSTSTIGYRPMITTDGAVKELSDEYMEKDIFICKNATETASYYWYKVDITVSKNSPTVYFRILSSRYAMEVQGSLTITEDTTYYFAVDNLNDGTELVDLTNATDDERNWCESALHMVYDARYDSEEALADVSARVDLRYVGDTNADGRVNIKDATYIQKFIADLISLDKTSIEVADVDSDGTVTIKDATALQKKLVALP